MKESLKKSDKLVGKWSSTTEELPSGLAVKKVKGGYEVIHTKSGNRLMPFAYPEKELATDFARRAGQVGVDWTRPFPELQRESEKIADLIRGGEKPGMLEKVLDMPTTFPTEAASKPPKVTLSVRPTNRGEGGWLVSGKDTFQRSLLILFPHNNKTEAQELVRRVKAGEDSNLVGDELFERMSRKQAKSTPRPVPASRQSEDELKKDGWSVHRSESAKAKVWGGAVAHPLSVAQRMAETLKRKHDFYETLIVPGVARGMYVVYYRKKRDDERAYTEDRLRAIHDSRSILSKSSDERQEHSLVVEPDDPRVDKWMRDPGLMDVRGIDTPAGSSGKKRTIGKKAKATKARPKRKTDNPTPTSVRRITRR